MRSLASAPLSDEGDPVMITTQKTPDVITQRRRSWRPLILRLHFYAGVFVAPFILIAAITGALYAMAPTLERVVYHDILTVEPGGQAQPLQAQSAAA